MAGKLLSQTGGSGVIPAEYRCPRLTVFRQSQQAQIVPLVHDMANLTRVDTPANKWIEFVEFRNLQESLKGSQRSRCRRRCNALPSTSMSCALL
jgi:hypothetical protein